MVCSEVRRRNLDMEDAVFAHVRQGTVVALADDLEYFASQMGLDVANIVVVELEGHEIYEIPPRRDQSTVSQKYDRGF